MANGQKPEDNCLHLLHGFYGTADALPEIPQHLVNNLGKEADCVPGNILGSGAVFFSPVGQIIDYS